MAGEWPCEVRDGPRGSGARRGRNRESGEDFGRRKRKILPAGPAGQRDRGGNADDAGRAVSAGRACGRERKPGPCGERPLRERLLGRALGEAGPSVCGWKWAQAV